MTGLAIAHLVFVSMWGGVVLVEVIVEALGLRDRSLAARLHFWIDVVAEIPLLACVLVTGALLAMRAWPPTGLLLAKIVTALIAVGLNLYCAVFVILRYRHRHDPARLGRYQTHVLASAVGVPFGAVAAYLGLSYFT